MTSDLVAGNVGARTIPARARTAAATATVGVRSFEFEPHNCFACGSLNEHGLRLDLHLERGRSWTEITLDRRFEGWAEIAHGGIIATILDEVMAWALVADDNWGVTARLAVDYRRPIRIGVPIRGEGWIVRARRRLVETGARIVDADGTELATAQGVYVAADEDRKRELQARYGFRVRSARGDGPPVAPAAEAAFAAPAAGATLGAPDDGLPIGPDAPDSGATPELVDKGGAILTRKPELNP